MTQRGWNLAVWYVLLRGIRGNIGVPWLAAKLQQPGKVSEMFQAVLATASPDNQTFEAKLWQSLGQELVKLYDSAAKASNDPCFGAHRA